MKKAPGKKIKIIKDGPYVVSGDVNLNQAIMATNAQGEVAAWKKGETYQRPEEPYHLCRCGHSKTKPYCDGAHEQAGFVGTERADRAPYLASASRQVGEDCTLLDDESLCVGARFCDRGATVWEYVDKSGDPANKAMAIEEACDCPAGRLTIMDNDGGIIEPQLPPEVSLIEDPERNCRGPLWVKGGIEVEGAEGEKYEVRNRVTLCRCGESKNQPFCDGRHYGCENMQGLDR